MRDFRNVFHTVCADVLNLYDKQVASCNVGYNLGSEIVQRPPDVLGIIWDILKLTTQVISRTVVV